MEQLAEQEIEERIENYRRLQAVLEQQAAAHRARAAAVLQHVPLAAPSGGAYPFTSETPPEVMRVARLFPGIDRAKLALIFQRQFMSEDLHNLKRSSRTKLID